ncbi:phosphatidylserine decarboxylase-domain-containing protein [Lactifluus subvellereus]|nr:phosphatidylserine decarboxylase-domain-containing protein [Lactifluus subvellereus]
MPISKRPISSIVFTVVHRRFFHLLPSKRFPNHVAPRSPTARSLCHSVNNHGALSTLYSRVPSNSYSHSRPNSPVPPSSSPPILLARRVRPRALRFSPFRTPSSSPAMRMYVSTERLSSAWRHTPMKWNPLPWFVGALLLVLIQYQRHRSEKEVHVDEDGHEVIKLKGPWQVHILGALPLRNLSRLWGWLNSFELPVWLRPIGFKFYAVLFGCDLTEIEPADLREYPSLGAFFYRSLAPGSRPIADAALVSPADGTVLHFGAVQGARVEQVKGLTYSLDALLGVERPKSQTGKPNFTTTTTTTTVPFPVREMAIVDDHEFANVNGIEYSLSQLIGTSAPTTPVSPTFDGDGKEVAPEFPTDRQAYERPSPPPVPHKHGVRIDASVVEPDKSVVADYASVVKELGPRGAFPGRTALQRRGTARVKPGNALFFTVIYLAPGDYHRFHSPTAWVVEKRRHFQGELFSVSPWVAKRVENLFVLNERVALLGRWRHGFFGMVPVGATNVGSIKINFDQALRTNVRGRPPPPGTYNEAVYSAASPILNGQPLRPGQEMGGFCLGSTIVLVFEAPPTFEFAVHAGQKVRVGQKLGDVLKGKEE